jgi:hypothetical protein
MARCPRFLRRHVRALLLAGVLAVGLPGAADATCFDRDDDGRPDPEDVCPAVADPDQVDSDLDGVGDACDCAPLDPDRFPRAPEVPDGDDEDCDAQVDEGPDQDGDGIEDLADVCPFLANPDQLDTDTDGTGDACEVLQVVEVWPPAQCSGVPAGLAPRVRFNQRLEAPVLAAGPQAAMTSKRFGPVGAALLLDDDGAGFRLPGPATLPAGEWIEVLVPASYGLAFGFQWAYQLAAVDADGFERAPDPAAGEVPPWSSAGVALADLDADGDLDLVLASATPGESVRTYRNRGDATFDRVPGGTPLSAADALEPGDFDGDGRVDILAKRTNGTVVWMRNVPDDDLVVQVPLAFSAVSIALGDYDADGAPDILAALAGLDGAAGRVWRNVGGAFPARVPGTGGGMMSGGILVDVDADGDLDVVTTHSGPNGTLKFWENGGSSGALPAATLTTRPRGVGPAASGDLDADGRPSVVAPADRVPGELYERAPDGGFAVTGTIPDNGNGRVQMLDDDGDGDADLWLEALGGGHWVRHRTDAGNPVPTSLSLPVSRPVFGDLDGDGDLDAVSPGTPAVVYLRRPDNCPADPVKLDPGFCGCGVTEQDTDIDLVIDCVDKCPGLANPDQADYDDDGIGDACETDDDNDGVPDFESGVVPWDFFPFDPNVCADDDGDGCDDCALGVDGIGPLPDKNPFADGPDADGDGLCDGGDVCRLTPDPAQTDRDGDGLGDACDPCPDDPSAGCTPLPDAGLPDAAPDVAVRDATLFPDVRVVEFDLAFRPDAGAPAPDFGSPSPDADPPTPDAALPVFDARAPTPDRGVVVPVDAASPAPDRGVEGPEDARMPAPDAIARVDAAREPAVDARVASPDSTRPPVDVGVHRDAASGSPDVVGAVSADGASGALDAEATAADADRTVTADATPVATRPPEAGLGRGLEPMGGGGCTVGGPRSMSTGAFLLGWGLVAAWRRRRQPAERSARPTWSPRA